LARPKLVAVGFSPPSADDFLKVRMASGRRKTTGCDRAGATGGWLRRLCDRALLDEELFLRPRAAAKIFFILQGNIRSAGTPRETETRNCFSDVEKVVTGRNGAGRG